MQRGEKLIILRETDAAPATSTHTQLIAALAALGIHLDNDCPYQETREIIHGREQRVTTWMLKPQSECGRYATQAMIRAWHSPDFIRENPEHPFAYVRAAFSNYRSLLETISSQAPLALIRKGERIALIPFDVTPERRTELLTALDQ